MAFVHRVEPEDFLFISDLQIPFHHPRALEFILYLVRHYRIPINSTKFYSQIMCLGDEVDQYFGSLYKQSINASHTCNDEFDAAIDELKRWTSAFPRMLINTSNHGQRWAKKAEEGNVHERMMKTYQNVLQIPDGWKYQLEWRVKTKHPFRTIHGMGYSGQNGHINAAKDAGISSVIGHLTHLGCQHIRTGITNGYKPAQKIWGMCVSCLIDHKTYAFNYSKDSRNKAALGTGLVFNSGTTPVVIPFDL